MVSSRQKKQIAVNKISDLIALSSDNELLCYRPVCESPGADLIVVDSDGHPAFVYVKSRFVVGESKRFILNIKGSQFHSHPQHFLCFAFFSELDTAIKSLWLMPSRDFSEIAPCNLDTYRFSGSQTERCKYWGYRTAPDEIGCALSMLKAKRGVLLSPDPSKSLLGNPVIESWSHRRLRRQLN